MLTALLLAPALATNPHTFVLPGAHEQADTRAELAVGPVMIASSDPWVAVGGEIEGSLRLGDRAELRLRTPVFGLPGAPERGSNLPSGAIIGGPIFGARFLAVDTPKFRLAPTLVLAGFGSASSTGGRGSGLMVMAGLAIEGGWDKVRLDLSTSLLGATRAVPDFFDGPLLWIPPNALVFSEAGVSFPIGEHHALRLGMLSTVPSVRWRYDADRFYIDAGVASLGVINLAQAHLGVSF